MIDHTGIGVANVARSAAFYDAALGALGLRRVMQLPPSNGTDGVGYGIDYPVFWISSRTRMVPSKVSSVVARLMECDLVARTDDRRVKLTKQGAAALVRVRQTGSAFGEGIVFGEHAAREGVSTEEIERSLDEELQKLKQ
jgi:catechol 2,3-dioxygenase-like lactoylglutathione lyase family enzyme